MLLPGESNTAGAGDLGELIWPLSVPQSSGTDEYYVELTCDGKYYGQLDANFGVGTFVANKYPYSTIKTGSDVDQLFAGEDSLTISVSNKVMTLTYDGDYTQTIASDNQRFWFVAPIVAGTYTSTSVDTADDCSATFKQKSQKTWSRTLLTISQTDNGPRFLYESPNRDYFRSGYSGSSTTTNGEDGKYLSPNNPNKVYVNYKDNLQFENGLGDGDSLDEIIMQQRMLYGMGSDSWCLVKLPKYF